MFKYALLTVGLLLTAMPLAQADGDIVYSARYYYPPGTKTDRTKSRSRFHLYRVNPDGTGRKQITSGRWDDTDPKWAPNGRSILFFRNRNSAEASGTRDALCTIDEGKVRQLAQGRFSWPRAEWASDGRQIALGYLETREPSRGAIVLINTRSGHKRTFAGFHDFVWSPDSRRLLIWNDTTTRLIEVNSMRSRSIPGRCLSACFSSTDRFVVCGPGTDQSPPTLKVHSIRGDLSKAVQMDWKVRPGGPRSQNSDRGVSGIEPMPGDRESIIAAFDIGNSGMSLWYQYVQVNLTGGKMTTVTDGQFLTWSPDRKRLLTSNVKSLKDYGQNRSLYMTRLLIGSPGQDGDKLKPIVSGQVWVVGADWRNARKVSSR